MENKNNNFMDPKTILAVVLVGLMWFGWQYYLQQKYPEAYKKKVEVTKSVDKQKSESVSKEIERNSLEKNTVKANVQKVVEKKEERIKYFSENFDLEISSQGMAIENVRLNKYTDREGKIIVLNGTNSKTSFKSLQSRLIEGNNPVPFEIKEKGNGVYVGRYVTDEIEIERTFVIDSMLYTISSSTKILKIPPGFKGISVFLTDKMESAEKSGSLFMPQFGRQEAYVAYGDTDNRIPVAASEAIEKDDSFYKQVNLMALSSHYFSTVFIDRSTLLPEAEIRQDKVSQLVIARLDYKPVSQLASLDLENTFFIGPKSVSLLEKVDENLGRVIDFGIFHVLAVPMLKLMNWFFDLFGNYGLAIILLTLTVRTIVLPFNLMSYKSMKTMQKIQPKIKALREKYKDEPQKLNQEMLVLMKQNKANPVGGCLPMLLQFPVFIALYQVFGQSIELYKAPFMLWIADLSLKDPYFILPVAMGITMFLQQRITPTSMDPAQAKILMFMPIMFTAFMLFLPSALTLYIFVSTLYAILQQVLFLRDKNKSGTVTEARV